MRLRERHLRRQASEDSQLIDLDAIFHDEDPLIPWIRETEDKLLDDRDNPWLDEALAEEEDKGDNTESNQHTKEKDDSSNRSDGGNDSSAGDDAGVPIAAADEGSSAPYYDDIHDIYKGGEYTQRERDSQFYTRRQKGEDHSHDPTTNEQLSSYYSGISGSNLEESSSNSYSQGYNEEYMQQQEQPSTFDSMTSLFGYSNLHHLYPSYYSYRDNDNDNEDNSLHDAPRKSMWY